MGCNCKDKKRSYNVINAVNDVILNKAEYVDEKEYEKRVNICFSCELYSPTLKICTDCKCFIKSKAKFKKSSCPVDKWGSVE